MLIHSINNLYNISKFQRKNTINQVNRFSSLNCLNTDVVSFSAKKYDADSVINPTNHCAYCGTKVYNEQQIDSLAKEMLTAKGDRLAGSIKSVLEKLEGAKNAQDIALAKRLENKEEIDFFNDFIQIVSKKAFLRGDAIFEQVYGLSKDNAYALLIKNLHPIQRTIDHVSPQKEDKDNQHSDVNLVEACYCCNHDLKKGLSFNEFYTMFPSIKNNMPAEKFDYASAGLLDSSQSNITQRLSASNLLKFLERLFVQRTEAVNYLDSVDFQIKSCCAGIDDAIQSCKTEIEEKESEIARLSKTNAELLNDPEYVAMCKRIELSDKLDAQNSTSSSLRERRQRVSNSLNELKNPEKSSKKVEKNNSKKLSSEEKEKRISTLRQNLELLNSQISSSDEKIAELSLQIELLDEEFPTLEVYQQRKSKAESIQNAYNALSREQEIISSNEQKLKEISLQEEELSLAISKLPENSKNFRLDRYSIEDQEEFKRWQDYTEALAYIDEHPNGGALKSIINQAARQQIILELDALAQEQSVIDYNNTNKRKQLDLDLAKVQRAKADITASITQSQKRCNSYRTFTSQMSLEKAQSIIRDCSESIRRLSEKQSYIKIPQRISTIRAEITLLKQTINDLHTQQNRMKTEYKIDT